MGIIVVIVIAGILIGGGLYYYSSLNPEADTTTPPYNQESDKDSIVKLEETSSQPDGQPAITTPKESETTKTVPPQKCLDGTPYGLCSTNKPKYCESGTLVDNSPQCGCPSGYDISDKKCVKQLTVSQDTQGKCVAIYEGNSDHSRAIDIIVIGADDSFSGKGYKYSNKIQSFVSDAAVFANEFLSTPPFNNFKNNFNFYYSSKIINCTSAPFGFGSVGGTRACKEWQDAANLCNTKHDIAAVLVNAGLKSIHTFGDNFYTVSPTGVISENNTIFSEQSSPVLIHEIGHVFNLGDEYGVGNIKSPNLYFGQEATGRPLCRIRKDPTNPNNSYYEETKSTEISGGTCSYQLRYFAGGYSPIYVTNEKSIMRADAYSQKKGFSIAGEQYLEKILGRIAQLGYEKWLPEKPRPEDMNFPTDQIPTVSVSDPPPVGVGEKVSITVVGDDNIGIRSLHILNFGDATFADYTCNGTPKTCTNSFTHTYTSPGTYYGRVQAQDSLGQGSNHKDFTIKITN